ncbi:MAG: MarR family transcriptional regulator [Candidatus Omnitrophica bacterium]|nr:MarR family transcriptional regulator [Candidatus Omnitrophota bacterium]
MGKDKRLERFIEEVSRIMPQVLQGIFRRQRADLLAKGEISIPQFLLMFLLCRKGFMKMKDIAHELNVSLPATTGLVNRLVRDGRVKRIPDEKDRRVVYIGITSRGKQVVNTVRNQRKKLFTEVFSNISEKERVQYLKVLRKVAKYVQVHEEK